MSIISYQGKFPVALGVLLIYFMMDLTQTEKDIEF